jgi:acetyl-CoA C-acetyltransferase
MASPARRLIFWPLKARKRAARAIAEGRFDNTLVEVKDLNGLPILTHDEYPRPGTDMQSLGALKPAFKDMGETMPGFDKVALMKYPHLERINHIHHAGNSSGIVDGAAGILIGSKAFGAAHGLKPRAVIRATAKSWIRSYDHADRTGSSYRKDFGTKRDVHFRY